MFLFFIIQLIVQAQDFVIDLNEDNKQWQHTIQSCLNCTFKIQSQRYHFIYVSVSLQSNNPKFYLISQGLSAVTNISSSQSSDMISVQENRLTRFLKIEKPKFPLYIQTYDPLNQTSFSITIKDSNSYECDNNCSMDVYATIPTLEIIASKWLKILKIYIIKFSIFQMHQYIFTSQLITIRYQGETINLEIETDNPVGIYFFIQKTQANVISDINNNDLNLVQTFVAFEPMTIQLTVPDYVPLYDRTVSIAKQKNSQVQSNKIKISLYVSTYIDDGYMSIGEIILITLGPAVFVSICSYCGIKRC